MLWTQPLPSVTPGQHRLTVILKPRGPITRIGKVNPMKVHEELKSPAGVISIRLNPTPNLLALDA